MHAVDLPPVRESVGFATRKSILIEFSHGLGDAVQLTIVLRHLRKYRPEWEVDVACLIGKDSAVLGLCRQVVVEGSFEHHTLRESSDHVYRLPWYECYNGYHDAPNTKVTNCLREIFRIEPDLSLYRYQIQIGQDARLAASDYLERIASGERLPNGRFPIVAIHYQANTSAEKKDLPHDKVAALCGYLLRFGYIPLILDWDGRSPLPNGTSIFCPDLTSGRDLWKGYGTGDAERIAALIDRCALMIGVDSGPLHVAGATETPTLGVWTGHPPSMFFDLCQNVLHLVPSDWPKRRPTFHVEVEEFFRERYRFREYEHLEDQPDAHQVFAVLTETSREILEGQYGQRPERGTYKTWATGALTSQSYGRDYYDQHRAAGLDYLHYGGWQRDYGRWFVESLGLKDKTVLDVGCACGSIMRGIGEAGALVSGVDVSEHMVTLAKTRYPDMRPILHCCDAINLHLYQDDTFDCIHSAQSAEHWRPDHVPLILRELWRVTKPGGLLWVSLDTQELYDRQQRDPDSEDATHVCIRSVAWWKGQLLDAAWTECSEQVRQPMLDHPVSYFKKYDWDWFAARKPS